MTGAKGKGRMEEAKVEVGKLVADERRLGKSFVVDACDQGQRIKDVTS